MCYGQDDSVALHSCACTSSTSTGVLCPRSVSDGFHTLRGRFPIFDGDYTVLELPASALEDVCNMHILCRRSVFILAGFVRIHLCTEAGVASLQK